MANYHLSEYGGHIVDDLRRLVDEIADDAAKAGYPLNIVYGSTTVPDHNTKRCVDLMINHLPRDKQEKAGDWLTRWLLARRSRAGVRFLIWNYRVVRSYPKPGIAPFTWARYTGSSNPHTDHVHLEVEPGYSYRPPKGGGGKKKKGKQGRLFEVSARGGLHARKSPEGANLKRGGHTVVMRNGQTIRVVGTKRVGGTKWAKGSNGAWYVAAYLTPKKA